MITNCSLGAHQMLTLQIQV